VVPWIYVWVDVFAAASAKASLAGPALVGTAAGPLTTSAPISTPNPPPPLPTPAPIVTSVAAQPRGNLVAQTPPRKKQAWSGQIPWPSPVWTDT
jgi:hypothetical protein